MPSNLRRPYLAAPGVYTLPSQLSLGDLGLLPVNAFVIGAREPILVDAGLAIDRGNFEQSLWSLVDPVDLRWIVVTHDDRDHTGNLKEVLLAAPNATVVTNALTVARLGEQWDLPRHRVRTVNPGRSVRLGDRTVSFVRPPSFDSPSTIAMYDHEADALFSADSFGTVLREVVDHAVDATPPDYREGMVTFTRANAPWAALADQSKWDRALAGIRDLNARTVLSSHAPSASGRADELIEIVRSIPSMEPWLPDEDQAIDLLTV